MYQGFTETAEAAQARMARRNALHAARMAAQAATPAPSVQVLPPMTQAQWWGLPAAVRYFHPLERATQALEIVTQDGPQ
jgi:hypothetical protein